MVAPSASSGRAARPETAGQTGHKAAPHPRRRQRAGDDRRDGDFQCTPCGELFPKLKKVEADYGERLRVVFRHRPMHKTSSPRSRPAPPKRPDCRGASGKCTICFRECPALDKRRGRGSARRRLPRGDFNRPILAMEIEVRTFSSATQILKLDVERFKTDIDSAEVKKRVDADQDRAEKLAVDRTPTLYLNGQLMLPCASKRADPSRRHRRRAQRQETGHRETQMSQIQSVQERPRPRLFILAAVLSLIGLADSIISRSHT